MLNLYKVTLRGMTISSTNMIHGISYVVASDPTEAYNKVRKHLDEQDLGFSSDRELDKIELLASSKDYNDTKIKLFI
jgi:hypothetical protein